MDDARALLRHAVATVAYRGAKVIRGTPESFATFHAGGASRPAGAILAHIGDLFDWALSLAKGEPVWRESAPLAWKHEIDRFFAALAAFDGYLASGQPLAARPAQLLQGPIADALTHIGQIAILRRLAGAPIRGENYFTAEIVAGRVGST